MRIRHWEDDKKLAVIRARRDRAERAREKFVAAAVRAAEWAWQIPRGWWGTYRDVHGPDGQRVVRTGYDRWSVTLEGKRIATLRNRQNAIAKARSLAFAIRDRPRRHR